jgi:hypothetical protein
MALQKITEFYIMVHCTLFIIYYFTHKQFKLIPGTLCLIYNNSNNNNNNNNNNL